MHPDILGNTSANNVRGGHTVHTATDYNNNDTDNHGYWGVSGKNGAGDLSGSRRISFLVSAMRPTSLTLLERFVFIGTCLGTSEPVSAPSLRSPCDITCLIFSVQASTTQPTFPEVVDLP